MSLLKLKPRIEQQLGSKKLENFCIALKSRHSFISIHVHLKLLVICNFYRLDVLTEQVEVLICGKLYQKLFITMYMYINASLVCQAKSDRRNI